MQVDNTEKSSKKTPFKFLSGVFKRGRNYELKITEDMLYGTADYQQPSPTMSRSYTKGQTTPGKDVGFEEEMEDLHLSRKDNPYLSSCEALDSEDFGDEPGSPLPGSPRQSTLSSLSPHSSSFSPESVSELHAHLIRSPPPVHWPTKTIDFETASNDWAARSDSSDRAFSPESGSDGMETERSYMGRAGGQRSHSVDRMISPGPNDNLLSPVRGQTPALSPARGQTPDNDLSPPPYDSRSRLYSTPSHNRLYSGYSDTRAMSPRSTYNSNIGYQRSVSHGQRVRSQTPDEEFSPTRFNIYTLHQRGITLRKKSESSYLVSSPGREEGRTFHYQPASRRSLAQLASNSRSGQTSSNARKSSTETFLSWIPRRSRSRGRADAKSMENLQSSTPPTANQGARNLRETSKFSHKSLSCMAGDSAGLINHEGGGGGIPASPRAPRNRFSSLKKSLSLKKAGGGPFYVDIDTQENL